MSGIKSSTSGNIFPQGSGLKDPVNNSVPTKITIPDYDDNQGKECDVEQFKKDVSSSLGTSADNITINSNKNGLTAKVKDSKNEIPIEFKDNVDLSRIAKYASGGSSVALVSFADDTNHSIKISNYNNGLNKEASIQLFKDDVAREMKTEVKNVEFFVEDDKIMAHKKNSSENYTVNFADPRDEEKFVDYAKETLSKRLQDFGIKKHQGSVYVGGSTNFSDPKNSTTITQGVTYSTYIGDSGKHRIIFNEETGMGLDGKFDPTKNLKDFSITYQNMDLPIIGEYGEIKLSYHEGKFSGDGHSDAIDIEADKLGKKYVDDMKHADPKAIAMTVGAAAAVVGGLYIAKDKLKDPKDLNVPLKTNIYSNGHNTIKAVAEPTITVGGGELGVSLHKGGVEVSQNIASGINFKEQVIYDFKEKSVDTQIEGNYNRAYLRLNNKYSSENKDLNHSYVSLGYSQVISEKTNISYSYNQELDSEFRSKNQNLGVGLEYNPSEKWRLNVGTGLGRPDNSSRLGVTFGAKLTFNF